MVHMPSNQRECRVLVDRLDCDVFLFSVGSHDLSSMVEYRAPDCRGIATMVFVLRGRRANVVERALIHLLNAPLRLIAICFIGETSWIGRVHTTHGF